MNPDIFVLKESLLLFKNELAKFVELDKEYPAARAGMLKYWQKKKSEIQ